MLVSPCLIDKSLVRLLQEHVWVEDLKAVLKEQVCLVQEQVNQPGLEEGHRPANKSFEKVKNRMHELKCMQPSLLQNNVYHKLDTSCFFCESDRVATCCRRGLSDSNRHSSDVAVSKSPRMTHGHMTPSMPINAAYVIN